METLELARTRSAGTENAWYDVEPPIHRMDIDRGLQK